MKILLCLLILVSGAVMASGISTMESSTGGIILELVAPTPDFTTINIRGDNFSVISMDGAETISDVSMPRIPVYRTWLEIPVGAAIEYSVSNETVLNVDGPPWPIEPGILSAPKSEPRENFTMELDESIYSSGRSFPDSWVRIIYAGHMRGRNLALVEVFPLRWNPADNSCDLLSEATITLSYEGGDPGESYARAVRYYAPPFERILSSMVSNYGLFEAGCKTYPAPYLIISHENFLGTDLDNFITWKESLGFDVTLVDLSVTGSTYQDIEAYILDAIENWTDPPVYVLLVGDTMYLPGNIAARYSGITDLYYVCLDDGGYFPDAFIGRFSVRTAEQIEVMANRPVEYEQNVNGFTSWVQNTCWIASNDQWNISEGTHNYCISTYLNPMDYTYDKIYPHTYGSNASDAITSINGGISMLTFSGHGSTTSWDDMYFNSAHFAQLNNDGMFPGVLSHACLTGSYGSGATSAWCETWTRTPSKGGLWFWGSVPSTYWPEDDVMEKGEYHWFLGEDEYMTMGFLNGGKLDLYGYYSGGGRSAYYFEAYNLMGDPSLNMAVWGVEGIEDQSGGIVPQNTGILIANPARSAAAVTLAGYGYSELNVFDLTGRLVETPFRGEISGTQLLNWDVSNLVPGMYFLQLVQGNEVSTARVMVIR